MHLFRKQYADKTAMRVFGCSQIAFRSGLAGVLWMVFVLSTSDTLEARPLLWDIDVGVVGCLLALIALAAGFFGVIGDARAGRFSLRSKAAAGLALGVLTAILVFAYIRLPAV